MAAAQKAVRPYHVAAATSLVLAVFPPKFVAAIMQPCAMVAEALAVVFAVIAVVVTTPQVAMSVVVVLTV